MLLTTFRKSLALEVAVSGIDGRRLLALADWAGLFIYLLLFFGGSLAIVFVFGVWWLSAFSCFFGGPFDGYSGVLLWGRVSSLMSTAWHTTLRRCAPSLATGLCQPSQQTIPDTPWGCHICLHWGSLGGVNVGIYCIHGLFGYVSIYIYI